ncbi:MAG: hypothetical protein IT516_06480 [Burkholderiales bacterium]|nr:hypothetical protein [Burkholderiales bacterium]
MANESDRPRDDTRDPTLAAGWRTQSREMPPPALDAAILAAAHRAVGSAPRAATAEALRPPRWWLPFAAAAVIGVVAVGLVQLASHDVIDVAPAPAPMRVPEAVNEGASPAPDATMPVAPMPAPPAATPPQDLAQSTVPAPQRSAARTPTLDHAAPASTPVAVEAERRREAERRTAEVAPPTTPAPAAEPAAPSPAAKPAAPAAEPAAPSPAAKPAAPAGVAAATREHATTAPGAAKLESAQAQGARDRAAAPASAPAAASGAAGALTQPRAAFSRAEAIELARDPDAWLARIGKLHDAGRDDEAIAELHEFDALVPAARERMPIALRRLLERAP